MLADIIPVVGTAPELSFFTYQVPTNLENSLSPGVLVHIPFRNKTILGIVKQVNTTTDTPLNKLKAITDAISPIPILPPHILTLAHKLSNINRSSLGSLIKNLLPPLGPRNLKKLVAALTPFKQQTKIATPPSFTPISSIAELKNILTKTGKQTGQELILVPEVKLIDEVLKLLPKTTKPLIVTSATSTKAYANAWHTARNTPKTVILGTRRALFLPFSNLKKIWVLEEGDPSYKSFDSAPRYLTGQIAERLAALTGAELAFVTHTPSVINYSKYTGALASLGSYEIIDMQAERRGGNSSVLSEDSEDALTQNRGNALILLNRKGSTTSISCRDCQFIFRCDNCQRPLIYSQKAGELRCLYCQTRNVFEGICPNCQGADLKLSGVGTELLERAIRLKPWAKAYQVERIDSEIKKPTLKSNSPLLIVATDQVFKYFLPSDFNLVVVLDADTPLFIPEYSAVEELWQRLRTLRFWLPPQSRLLIQTRHPEHNLFIGLSLPNQFYSQELSARKLFGYPPAVTLLKAYTTGPDARITAEAEAIRANLLRLTKPIKIATIEPIRPAFPPRLHGELRLVLIIKFAASATEFEYAEAIKFLPPKWKIDFNPLNLLSI